MGQPRFIVSQHATGESMPPLRRHTSFAWEPTGKPPDAWSVSLYDVCCFVPDFDCYRRLWVCEVDVYVAFVEVFEDVFSDLSADVHA